MKTNSDRNMVDALKAAGLDLDGLRRFHAALERQDPAFHEAFLAFLGLAPDERKEVRERSRHDSSLLPS